jgi:hypothetical protein
MAAEERIETHHPEGKAGVRILRRKYETVREAILDILRRHREPTFVEFNRLVAKELVDSFNGSPGWYFVTVKLDLEARGEIERVPNSKPQCLRIPSQSRFHSAVSTECEMAGWL